MKSNKFLAVSGILALALILTPIMGLAAPVIFFGEDLGLGSQLGCGALAIQPDVFGCNLTQGSALGDRRGGRSANRGH